jgi:hypothetical protein
MKCYEYSHCFVTFGETSFYKKFYKPLAIFYYEKLDNISISLTFSFQHNDTALLCRVPSMLSVTYPEYHI